MPIPLHVKHWNDRADRDLFFSILSVKNIGVISGAEWTVIGNDMRTLGYGFTNEGCRQHFQGLRRSIGGKKKTRADDEQDVEEADVVHTVHAVHAVHSVAGTGTSVLGVQAASSVGSLPANVNGVDPTRNPITRRPGPGRGRPKKKKGDDTKDSSTPAGLSAELLAVANGLRPLLPAGAGSSTGTGSGSGANEAGREVSASPPQGQKRRRSQPQDALSPIHTHAQYQHTSAPQLGHTVSRSAVFTASSTLGDADETDGTESHPDDTEDADGNGNNGPLQNKRQRLNGTALPSVSAVPVPAPADTAPPLNTLQDDTVLAALAAHGNAAFPADFPFEA
ncbi:hypothetical protein F503_08107 [Ophiostoma piceae UAMH 11346]|uniref:Myb-like domain-containing protein n=1 Tax=Ophiostoma piceae (strain UAMH 11346) TaxID=1262450 RepID=S3C6E2_OPHP1|nr:hypothetical protein F503_08107 [Ophiostoma piceae UAMH 11346]